MGNEHAQPVDDNARRMDTRRRAGDVRDIPNDIYDNILGYVTSDNPVHTDPRVVPPSSVLSWARVDEATESTASGELPRQSTRVH
jgi:hypothetical protein